MKIMRILFISMLLFSSWNLFGQDIERVYVIDSLKYGKGKVYSNPEVKAQFPGGYERMNEFFSTYFDPYVESNGGMQGEKEGTVEALFIVETNGKVKYVEITKPLTNLFDEQMESSLKRMPKWSPALVNGVPVRSFSKYSYSLKFYMK